MTADELIAEMTAAAEASMQYRAAAERHSQKALRALHAGHRVRSRIHARLALRLQSEAKDAERWA